MGKIPMVWKENKNDLDIISKVLSIYSVIKDIKLLNFERLVLKYYLKFGYNDTAKKYLMEYEDRKLSDLKNTNHKLRAKGFLVKSKNTHTTELSEDMKSIRKNFIEDGQKMYLISFLNMNNVRKG